MKIAQLVITPKNHKNHLLDIATRISEGKNMKYITGSGQTLATTRRVMIYEREGMIAPVRRPDRKRTLSGASTHGTHADVAGGESGGGSYTGRSYSDDGISDMQDISEEEHSMPFKRSHTNNGSQHNGHNYEYGTHDLMTDQMAALASTSSMFLTRPNLVKRSSSTPLISAYASIPSAIALKRSMSSCSDGLFRCPLTLLSETSCAVLDHHTIHAAEPDILELDILDCLSPFSSSYHTAFPATYPDPYPPTFPASYPAECTTVPPVDTGTYPTTHYTLTSTPTSASAKSQSSSGKTNTE